MKQEHKSLLLQDLSARLPYGVKVAIEISKDKYTRVYDLREIDNDTTSELRQRVTIWNYGVYSSVISYPLIECRPYLRPMSSMTEDEKIDLKLCYPGGLGSQWLDAEKGTIEIFECSSTITLYLNDSQRIIDWLNKKMFDYRGLIEKGLALEAPKDMYK